MGCHGVFDEHWNWARGPRPISNLSLITIPPLHCAQKRQTRTVTPDPQSSAGALAPCPSLTAVKRARSSGTSFIWVDGLNSSEPTPDTMPTLPAGLLPQAPTRERDLTTSLPARKIQRFLKIAERSMGTSRKPWPQGPAEPSQPRTGAPKGPQPSGRRESICSNRESPIICQTKKEGGHTHPQ